MLWACLGDVHVAATPVYDIIDYGCGTGCVLARAVETGMCRRGVGIEVRRDIAGVGVSTDHVRVFVADLRHQLPTDVSDHLAQQKRPRLHYVYDGGVLPDDVSRSICRHMRSLSDPASRACVIVPADSGLISTGGAASALASSEWDSELAEIGFERTAALRVSEEDPYTDEEQATARAILGHECVRELSMLALFYKRSDT